MPNTENYSFSFESPGSLPGTTLTGGPESGNAILARQVDTALAAVETKVDANTANITANATDIADNADNLSAFVDRFQTGTELISFSNLAATIVGVSFPIAFSTTPIVMTNIDTGSGVAARWISRAINIGGSGFTLFVFATDDNGTETQSWTDIPVSWLAFGT